jgi:hypothetical protein
MMGSVKDGWQNTVEQALYNIYTGDSNSITQMNNILSGVFVDGGGKTVPALGSSALVTGNLRDSIETAFYAFGIPPLWQASSTFPFITTSNTSCANAANDPLSFYINSDLASKTSVCGDDGIMYYLVAFNGEGTDASTEDTSIIMPPGLDTLNAGKYANLTRDILVKG